MAVEDHQLLIYIYIWVKRADEAPTKDVQVWNCRLIGKPHQNKFVLGGMRGPGQFRI